MCSVYGTKTMFPLVPLVPRAVPPVSLCGICADLAKGGDKNKIGNVGIGETPAGNQRYVTRDGDANSYIRGLAWTRPFQTFDNWLGKIVWLGFFALLFELLRPFSWCRFV